MTQKSRLRRFIPALVIVLGGAAHAQTVQKDAADAARLVEAMNVKPGSVIAEIGAGEGQLTMELAKAVGPTGRIYSNELSADALDTIRTVARALDLKNVTTIEGKADAANLPDACCDGIFMRNVYHHFGDPPSMNASLLKALKPGGTLAIIDFTPPPPSDQNENPPGHRGEDNHHGITAATLVKELSAAGFEVVSSATTAKEVFVVARRPAAS